MGEKQKEDLYRNFSRKDLQGLCKKYGLPANKSNSEMATSLILYLEKENISSKTIWAVSRSGPYPPLWSEFQPGVMMNSEGIKKTDVKEMSSHNGFSQVLKQRDPDHSYLGKCKGPASSDKASEDMGLLTQPHRESNSGAGDAENAFSSVLSSTVEPSLPIFSFDVSCEDGIQLCVDLNSTRQDWIESMKAGVHICHDIHDLKSSSSDERHNNAQLEDESCPSTVGTGVALQAEEFVGGSLPSPGLESYRNTVHNVEDLGEERAMIPYISKSIIEPRNCGSECLIRTDKEVGTNSDASLVIQTRTHKLSGNTMPHDLKCSKTGDGMYKDPLNLVSKNIRLSGTSYVGIEASPNVNCLKRHEIASSSRVATCLVSDDQPQSSRIIQFGSFSSGQFCGDGPQVWPAQANGQSQYISPSYFTNNLCDAGHGMGIQRGRGPEEQTQLVRSCEKNKPYFPFQMSPLTNANLDTSIERGYGGLITSYEPGQVSVELPKKNSSFGPFNIGGPLHLAIPKNDWANHQKLSYSNHPDKDVCRSQLRNDLGRSKAGDGNTSSELDKVRQSMEEHSLTLPSSGYNEFSMKRHFSNVDDQHQSQSPDAKILRTSNHFPGDGRTSRRRSTRPFTK